MSQELNLEDWFVYDVVTSRVLWKKNRSVMKAGDPAGSLKPDGYIQVKFNGRMYQAHRIAWYLVYGEFPEFELDHKNGNGSDNRMSNLREATHAQNAVNVGLRKNNTSGLKGVHFCKKEKKWIAQLNKDRKKIRIGCFLDPLEAYEAYCAAASMFHGVFANFGERLAMQRQDQK